MGTTSAGSWIRCGRMKIILSPSKTQKRDPGEPVDPGALLNQEKTLALFSRLQGMSLKELEKALSVKGSLAEETFRLYQEHRPEKPGFAALDCYEGRAFQALEERCPSPQGKARREKHLVILSAMYGLVTPGTRIWPYRLDFKAWLPFSLLSYWKEEVEGYFREEDLVVNLASEEFSRLLTRPMLQLRFLDRGRDGSLKVISALAKEARGWMAGAILEEGAFTREAIRELCPGGYTYREELSLDDEWVYVKEKGTP